MRIMAHVIVVRSFKLRKKYPKLGSAVNGNIRHSAKSETAIAQTQQLEAKILERMPDDQPQPIPIRQPGIAKA